MRNPSVRTIAEQLAVEPVRPTTEELRSRPWDHSAWYEDWTEVGAAKAQTNPWSPSLAAQALKITVVPYTRGPGSSGFSIGRNVSVSPNAPDPVATFIHEVAHVELFHTVKTTKSETVMESQAETVAFCLSALIGAVTEHSLYRHRLYYRTHCEPLNAYEMQRASDAMYRIWRAGRR